MERLLRRLLLVLPICASALVGCGGNNAKVVPPGPGERPAADTKNMMPPPMLGPADLNKGKETGTPGTAAPGTGS